MHDRFEQLRASRSNRVASPTTAELEKALRQRVRACELHRENWRNRVYRVELGSGAIVIAKQILMGTEEMVRQQIDELNSLGQLQVPGLHVARALALLPEKRLLVMEFVPGQTITALLLTGTRREEGVRACGLAGAVLARLHRAWGGAVCPIPVEQLAQDMATAPWRLSPGQGETLKRTLEEIAVAKVSVGRIHYDYEPDNLLWDGKQLCLIDPSTGSHWGVRLFEVATFCSALRRRRLRSPLGWRRGLLGQAIREFQRGYLAEGRGGDLAPRLFILAVLFFELQRVAQLFVGQKAKIDMRRRKDELGWEVESFLTSWAPLGAAELYKRWLFRQLARQLSAKTQCDH